MGALTPLALTLIVAAFLVGILVGAAMRRPKTIVEDADARRLEHYEREARYLAAKMEEREADNLNWAQSHQALADELAAAKEAVDNAANPPELAEAREKVETLTAQLEELQASAKDVAALTSELDTARGRAAELERELTRARNIPAVPLEDFVETSTLKERIAVLDGELATAQTRIAQLEAQVVSD